MTLTHIFFKRDFIVIKKIKKTFNFAFFIVFEKKILKFRLQIF